MDTVGIEPTTTSMSRRHSPAELRVRVEKEGFEPSSVCLQNSRSTVRSYIPVAAGALPLPRPASNQAMNSSRFL